MDRSARFWDRVSKGTDRQRERLEPTSIKTVENTEKHLKASDVVLDYGCGTGTITLDLAGHVKEMYALDISSGMIDTARRKAGERGIENTHFAQSTIFDEGIKSGSFTVVCAFNVIHLLPDAPAVMQRIHELLAPGGLFISATACMGEKRTLMGQSLFLLSKIGLVPFLKMLSVSELEGLVADGGFRIVETEMLQDRPPNYYIVGTTI